ncbi:hypothetical protein Aazo_4543 ['Nostoc azollae' 0708]|jgi:hypothetical protein|uniref:Uncharacterized protein n=1 Tax=Nostoc azollae (strain 0708) TaxID=551115 RepID=D7DX89_NOSA0|nr:hypothetical protein Aazo_4543 ['Nostoc azollae' 0708]
MTELINDFLFTVHSNNNIASQILFKFVDKLEKELSISKFKHEIKDEYILSMELE